MWPSSKAVLTLERLDAALLNPIEESFSHTRAHHPGVLPCAQGCASCCVSGFEITVLDLWRLGNGLLKLSTEIRTQLEQRAQERLDQLHKMGEALTFPYDVRMLSRRGKHLLSQLIDSCAALRNDGACQLYESRPRICRLQGLSFVDPEGGLSLEDGCAEVFGDAQYAALPPQELALGEQWLQEQMVRFSCLDHLPLKLDSGYITLVAGAILFWRDAEAGIAEAHERLSFTL